MPLQHYLEHTNLTDMDEEAVIAQLDDYFLLKNISPGGSANLLAIVYFLHFLSRFNPKGGIYVNL